MGETFAVGSGTGISIAEIARLLGDLVAVDKPIIAESSRRRPDRSEVRELVCDPTRARTVLGWSAATPLAAGLGRAIEFMRVHSRLYRSGTYEI